MYVAINGFHLGKQFSIVISHLLYSLSLSNLGSNSVSSMQFGQTMRLQPVVLVLELLFSKSLQFKRQLVSTCLSLAELILYKLKLYYDSASNHQYYIVVNVNITVSYLELC